MNNNKDNNKEHATVSILFFFNLSTLSADTQCAATKGVGVIGNSTHGMTVAPYAKIFLLFLQLGPTNETKS